MHLYLYVRTLTFFHIPGLPLTWSEERGAIVDFAQANLLTARLVQAVQSKESSNGADEVHEGPPGRGYLLVAGIDPIQISPDGINPECHRLFLRILGRRLLMRASAHSTA